MGGAQPLCLQAKAIAASHRYLRPQATLTASMAHSARFSGGGKHIHNPPSNAAATDSRGAKHIARITKPSQLRSTKGFQCALRRTESLSLFDFLFIRMVLVPSVS